jgi:hypothetical protein
MAASVPEMVGQQIRAQRAAKKTGAPAIDCLTAQQVQHNAHLGTTELAQRMRQLSPRALRGRRRMPALMRRRTMPGMQEFGGQQERWTFGYLFDVVLTRDAFMHRIDISRATGIPVPATADHEGVLVDDVVRDWAGRHGRPYSLELTGPAGGSWGVPEGERLTMDALEFCRVLSGRGTAVGLLTHQVPF